uniref:Uncharacterized protein n=1 Tax=Ixodes ricinus TaxID=34613 RepID=A0A6B0UTT7_IXORI
MADRLLGLRRGLFLANFSLLQGMLGISPSLCGRIALFFLSVFFRTASNAFCRRAFAAQLLVASGGRPRRRRRHQSRPRLAPRTRCIPGLLLEVEPLWITPGPSTASAQVPPVEASIWPPLDSGVFVFVLLFKLELGSHVFGG